MCLTRQAPLRLYTYTVFKMCYISIAWHRPLFCRYSRPLSFLLTQRVIHVIIHIVIYNPAMWFCRKLNCINLKRKKIPLSIYSSLTNNLVCQILNFGLPCKHCKGPWTGLKGVRNLVIILTSDLAFEVVCKYAANAGLCIKTRQDHWDRMWMRRCDDAFLGYNDARGNYLLAHGVVSGWRWVMMHRVFVDY